MLILISDDQHNDCCDFFLITEKEYPSRLCHIDEVSQLWVYMAFLNALEILTIEHLIN